jgi:UPF0716 protein FxsA
MLGPKTVLGLLDRDAVLRLLLFLLLYSVVPLAEILLLIYLGGLMGSYLVLAVAASTGFVGVFVAYGELRSNIARLRRSVAEGRLPTTEFVNVAGILVGALFLLSPGFITDCLGLLLFLPPVRRRIGLLLIRRLRINVKELYEYLHLYDMR